MNRRLNTRMLLFAAIFIPIAAFILFLGGVRRASAYAHSCTAGACQHCADGRYQTCNQDGTGWNSCVGSCQ